MYRTLEVLVINWETLNCAKMEQFLTLLSQNQWRNENLFDNREERLEHSLHVS